MNPNFKLTIISSAAILLSANTFAQANETTLVSPVPNAKPGECYAQTYIPPVYATEVQRVEKKAASKRIEVIPARYDTVTQTVVVKEESKQLQLIPAVFDTVIDRVLVKPESKKLTAYPPVYETVQERIVTKPGYSYWKPGRGNFERTDSTTGEILCLVEVPAEFDVRTKQVLKSPATVREEVVPAEYASVNKTVMKVPPTTREIIIPAVTKTVEVRRELEPAKQNVIDIPAEFATSEVKKLVSPGRQIWRSIICETNATPDKIREIQTALLNKGYNPGAVDGVLGADTMRAVNSFENDNRLPISKNLDVQTVVALGVTPR